MGIMQKKSDSDKRPEKPLSLVVLNWITGLLVIVVSLYYFDLNFVGAGALFIAGILTLPVCDKFIFKKLRIQSWMKMFLILVLVIVFLATLFNMNML